MEEDLLDYLKKTFYNITSSGTSFRPSFTASIDCFISTGNCKPIKKEDVVCLNPTLLKTKPDGHLAVKMSSSPFDAYFPIPFNEPTEETADASASAPILNDTYSYCKGKLGSLLSTFLQRKNRIELHFHFGDFIELCLYKDYMKEKFQVIFCSAEIECELELANIVSAARGCLSAESNASVLLTNIYLPGSDVRMGDSVTKYIESILCCPLSMIPTLYGVKLCNHLKLGGQVCVQMNDNIMKNVVTLKWLKVPGYSTNIPLDISASLKQAIYSLAARRNDGCGGVDPFKIRLRTCYFIIQSLFQRCRLLQDAPAVFSLVQSDVQTSISPDLRLNWRTEEVWMKGEPVLAYSVSKTFRPIRTSRTVQEIKQWNKDTPIRLMLVDPSISERLSCVDTESTSRVVFANNSYQIDLWIIQNEKELNFSDLTVKHLLDPTFTFLLPKDHGIDPRMILCVMKGEPNDTENSLRDLDELNKICHWKLVTNLAPFTFHPSQPPTKEPTIGLFVLKCAETEDRYDLEIGVRGISISSANGMQFLFSLKALF